MERAGDGSKSPDVVKLAVVAALSLASAGWPRFPLEESSLDWLQPPHVSLTTGRFTYVLLPVVQGDINNHRNLS